MADVARLRSEVIQDLQRLLEAIDRRLPRIAHIGEPAIAQDALELRAKAVALLAKLESAQ